MRQRADAWGLGMAYPPCRLTEATELGVPGSSGVGLPAIRARRLPTGWVPDTTALLDAGPSYRTPQGCDVDLRAAR